MYVCASREQTLLDESSSANHKTNKVEYSMANLMCKKISGRARTGRRGERRASALAACFSFPHYSQGRVLLFTGPVGLIYSLRPQPPWQCAPEVANFVSSRKMLRLCFSILTRDKEQGALLATNCKEIGMFAEKSVKNNICFIF
jgi:hypothetical protein